MIDGKNGGRVLERLIDGAGGSANENDAFRSRVLTLPYATLPTNTFLISGGHHRTLKYLFASVYSPLYLYPILLLLYIVL